MRFPSFLINIIVFTTLFLAQQSHSFAVTPSCSIGINTGTVLSMSESDLTGEADQNPPEPQVKCPDCDLCDGSGRILGGIPTILPWWPIKPYRPCPNFIARGGQYSRIGQPLDEIAFGRGNINVQEEDDDF